MTFAVDDDLASPPPKTVLFERDYFFRSETGSAGRSNTA
jgi:hypothetical protein